jgi:ferrous iron transport protein B
MNCHQCQGKTCGDLSNSRRKWGLLKWFNKPQVSPAIPSLENSPRIALVGMPNVGKSVLFNALTGTYVTVSNYPGTTVEVSRGEMKLGDLKVTVIDTPGMYSLLPITEEERVARNLLFNTHLDAVIHVIDAKSLSRMLPLTFQLLEVNLSVILAINMIDETERLGIQIHGEFLEEMLKIPVTMMSATLNTGVQELKRRIALHVQSHCLHPTHRTGNRQNRVATVPG